MLNTFEVDNGYLPKGQNGLEELMQPSSQAHNWHGPYLEKMPEDPWNNHYLYQCPGNHNPSFYDLSSAGPDGVPGTDDDITNW